MQLSQTVINQLREMWRDYTTRRASSHPQRQGVMIVPLLYVAKIGGTAITAEASDISGTGTVTLQVMDRTTGELSDRTDAGGTPLTVTCRNFVPTASGTSKYCFVTQDVDGVYWIISEAC